MSSHRSSAKSDANTFNILLATDCHLGYEYSKKRGVDGDDSFNTFEEILQYAQEYEVDFILLGGDLFHDAKPSQKVLIRCTELLRKYCLGTRENKIEFLSDPEVIFEHCANKTVNFEDPNLNVSIPVFSIHGNHDDPSFAALGSMDLLSASGLVNYFGKWTDLTKIAIPPLVMRKGTTYLCIYGLSYINDQRLSRLIRDMKMDMLRPEGIPEPFNMFVLHQNRVPRKEYSHIPENKLPNFLHFIVWGHEHECRITPEYVAESEYFICQPGSSIATSLCEAEAQPKHVGILSIRGTEFKIKKLKLRTVRPLVFDDVILRDHMEDKDYTKTESEFVYDFIDKRIESVLIPKAAAMLTNHPKQPTKALFRIRVHFSNENEMFDVMRLGQKYCHEIANALDMIVFRKDKGPGVKMRGDKHKTVSEVDDMAQLFDYETGDGDWCKTIPDGMKNYFQRNEHKEKLTVLSINGLNGALSFFVDKGNPDAFREIVQHQMQKTIDHISKCDAETEEDILEKIKNYRNKRFEKIQEQQEREEISTVLSNSKRSTSKASERSTQHQFADSDDENQQNESDKDEWANNTHTTSKKKSQAQGRGRGTRGGRGRAKANEKKSSSRTKTQTQSTLQPFVQSQSTQSSRSRNAGVLFVDDSD